MDVACVMSQTFVSVPIHTNADQRYFSHHPSLFSLPLLSLLLLPSLPYFSQNIIYILHRQLIVLIYLLSMVVQIAEVTNMTCVICTWEWCARMILPHLASLPSLQSIVVLDETRVKGILTPSLPHSLPPS